MMKHRIYLALGTNQGDRLDNLRRARQVLPPKVELVACSAVYETPPWGYLDQPNFLNQVIQAESSLTPQELIDYLKTLERQLGRQENFSNGPRLIDLDLLFYDDLQYESPGITIPHPRLEGRGFVLLPLVELAPELRHPGSGKTARAMLAECDLQGIRIYSPAESECSG